MSDSGNSSPSASTPSVDASSVKSKGLIELFKVSRDSFWGELHRSFILTSSLLNFTGSLAIY